MLLRDQAQVRAKQTGWESAQILNTIEKLGAVKALATMTDEQCNKVACAMRWMMGVARDVNAVFASDYAEG